MQKGKEENERCKIRNKLKIQKGREMNGEKNENKEMEDAKRKE